MSTELYDGDTRQHNNRSTWDGQEYDGPLGELWVRVREDGYELLSTDRYVVITDEFLAKMIAVDPGLSATDTALDIGHKLMLNGVDGRSVVYEVIGHRRPEMIRLLRLVEIPRPGGTPAPS